MACGNNGCGGIPDLEELIQKYDVPAPRYTSYPTVPYWTTTNDVPVDKWTEAVKLCFDETNPTMGISVYIHLPYCESLCTYCACNKIITKYHRVEEPYIEALLQEWNIYLKILSDIPVIRELHLGGGTPTFFSPTNLRTLLSKLLESSKLHPQHELSFEAHPNSTTTEHLQVLYDLGFRRLSLGIQDFDPTVQDIVNRIQTYETVEQVVNTARQIGYSSINFDLIYGLPKQNLDSVRMTIGLVGQLRPDRIAYYSYGHVPWAKTQQRKFSEEDLPSKNEKRALYELGKSMLLERGYEDVGMDHFSLPSDSLRNAKREGKLHRNFMGYCTTPTKMVLALGASSISDVENAYMQNEKDPELYKKIVSKGELPIVKGHFLNEEDLLLRKTIFDIACLGKATLTPQLMKYLNMKTYNEIKTMEKEGIVQLKGEPFEVKLEDGEDCQVDGNELHLTSNLGNMMLRNVCALFDNRMKKQRRDNPTFSKAI